MSYTFRGGAADFGKDQLSINGIIISPYETLTVPISASTVSTTVFTCDQTYQLVSISEVHGTASTSGTLMAEKCTGTTAPGSGTALLTGTMSLSGTANTVVNGTLVSTLGTTNFAVGERLSIKIAGTMTNLANGCVTIILRRI